MTVLFVLFSSRDLSFVMLGLRIKVNRYMRYLFNGFVDRSVIKLGV